MRVDLSGQEGQVTRVIRKRGRVKLEVEVSHPKSGFTFNLVRPSEDFTNVVDVFPVHAVLQMGAHLQYGMNGPEWVCLNDRVDGVDIYDLLNPKGAKRLFNNPSP
jgi:hypothetical protein